MIRIVSEIRALGRLDNMLGELDPAGKVAVPYLHRTLVGTYSQCFLIAHLLSVGKGAKGLLALRRLEK